MALTNCLDFYGSVSSSMSLKGLLGLICLYGFAHLAVTIPRTLLISAFHIINTG